jgi:hypothetical protein
MKTRITNSPLSHMCLAISQILDMALATDLITEEDHQSVHSAVWKLSPLYAPPAASEDEAA